MDQKKKKISNVTPKDMLNIALNLVRQKCFGKISHQSRRTSEIGTYLFQKPLKCMTNKRFSPPIFFLTEEISKSGKYVRGLTDNLSLDTIFFLLLMIAGRFKVVT